MKKYYMTLYGPLDSDARVLRSIDALASMDSTITILSCNTKGHINNSAIAKNINLQLKFNIWGYLLFCVKCLLTYLKCCKTIDVIYLHDYYSVIPGLLIFPIKGKRKIIYDAHELILPLDDNQYLPLKKKMFIAAEKLLASKADCIFEANKERRDIFAQKYSLKNVSYILNISNIEYKPVKRNIRPNDDIYLVYQGVISKNRNLLFFMDCMLKLPQNVKLMYIGEGEALAELKDYSNKLSLQQRVIFTGKLSNKDMIEMLAHCHIGIISYPFSDLNNIYCAPNKVFEYAAMSLPFISTDQKFMRRISQTYHVGKTFQINDVDSFCDAYHNLIINLPIPETFETFLSEYRWENEVRRFTSSINDLFN